MYKLLIGFFQLAVIGCVVDDTESTSDGSMTMGMTTSNEGTVDPPREDPESLAGDKVFTVGPDSRIYVVSSAEDTVRRFDGSTGSFVDRFVWDRPDTVDDEAGGMSRPSALSFGPEGWLYVASAGTDEILRFDGVSGAFHDMLVRVEAGELGGLTRMAFEPDGALVLTNEDGSRRLVVGGDPGYPAAVDGFARVMDDPLVAKCAYLCRAGGHEFHWDTHVPGGCTSETVYYKRKVRYLCSLTVEKNDKEFP